MLDGVVSDPRAAKLIQFLDTRAIHKLPDDLDQIAPEEMASVFRIGVSLADVQARNVQRRTLITFPSSCHYGVKSAQPRPATPSLT